MKTLSIHGQPSVPPMVSTNDPDPSSTVQVSSIQEPTVTTQSSVLDDILVYPSVPESKKSRYSSIAQAPVWRAICAVFERKEGGEREH